MYVEVFIQQLNKNKFLKKYIGNDIKESNLYVIN